MGFLFDQYVEYWNVTVIKSLPRAEKGGKIVVLTCSFIPAAVIVVYSPLKLSYDVN